MRQAILLRYRLMPYIYNLAYHASTEGTPLMRPFFWVDPQAPANWQIDDQFFLGRDLLVAPLLEDDLEVRKVNLPEGCWYSFWNHARYEGPEQIEVETSLDSIPVFVRGGAILPLEGQTLELHVYPGAGHTSEQPLYMDAGDGYGLKRLDTLVMSESERVVEVEWIETGEFPFPYDEIEIHLHGSKPRAIFVDGIEMTSASLPLKATKFKELRFEI
jgi:alpha-glucosidase